MDRLRAIFLLERKYNRIADFFLKVISPAQKELEESKSPYWFTYDKIKEGRAFKYIQFNVHYRPEYDKKIPQKSAIQWEVKKEFLNLLNQSLGTDNNTWKKHRLLIAKAQEMDYDKVKKILRSAQGANNPIGYTINAFKIAIS